LYGDANMLENMKKINNEKGRSNTNINEQNVTFPNNTDCPH